MTALPASECGFYTSQFKKYYDNIINFETEFDTLSKPEKGGFINSVIVEYCPEAAYDTNILWKDLKEAPWHPRAYKIGYRPDGALMPCHSGYEDFCCGYTDGELDSDERIKITKFIRMGSSQTRDVLFSRGEQEGMTSQRTACYVPVPFVEGTSRYFWIDLNKGVRAIYFPVIRKYSDATQDLGVWVKLDLSRHERTYNAFSTEIGQKTNYAFNKWKNAKCDERGLLETNKTIYVDVFEYIMRCQVPSILRSEDADPYNVVYWGNCNALQVENKGKAFYFNIKHKNGTFIKRYTDSRVGASKGYLRVDKSLSNALVIDLKQQNRKIYPGWISPVVSVGTFVIGFIPFVGPVLSLTIDVIEMIAKKSINDDWGDEKELIKDLGMKTGKGAWDTLNHDQQQDVKKGLKKTAVTFLKCFRRSLSKSKSLNITISLPDIDDSEMAEYRGLTIYDLWAKENAQLHYNADLCNEENPNADLCDDENVKTHPNADLCNEENLCDDKNVKTHPNADICNEENLCD